jgi:hypothetical protein
MKGGFLQELFFFKDEEEHAQEVSLVKENEEREIEKEKKEKEEEEEEEEEEDDDEKEKEQEKEEEEEGVLIQENVRMELLDRGLWQQFRH